MESLLELSEHQGTGGAPPTRDELVVCHLPLVKRLVDRISASLPSALDRDDLKSVASIGLISAAERFDPARGVLFRTFAEQRIRGAVMDALRSQDQLPRKLRREFKRMEREFSLLEQRLGRAPCSEEVASAMGLELEAYFRFLNQMHLFSLVQLDDSRHGEDGASLALLHLLEDKGKNNPQEQLIAKQAVEQLSEAVEKLSNAERVVVTLYYYEELTLKEIGSVLGLTESRIAQLRAKALLNLRRKIKRPA